MNWSEGYYRASLIVNSKIWLIFENRKRVQCLPQEAGSNSYTKRNVRQLLQGNPIPPYRPIPAPRIEQRNNKQYQPLGLKEIKNEGLLEALHSRLKFR